MGYDINKLFPGPKKVKRNRKPKLTTYDISIKLNKCGREGQWIVRFGLRNNAAMLASKFNYIQVSDAAYQPEDTRRLFFRLSNSKKKEDSTYHMLCCNVENPSSKDSRYFAITPNKEQEQLYRKHWIGSQYRIVHDEDPNHQSDENHDVFYIEKTKEE